MQEWKDCIVIGPIETVETYSAVLKKVAAKYPHLKKITRIDPNRNLHELHYKYLRICPIEGSRDSWGTGNLDLYPGLPVYTPEKFLGTAIVKVSKKTKRITLNFKI